MPDCLLAEVPIFKHLHPRLSPFLYIPLASLALYWHKWSVRFIAVRKIHTCIHVYVCNGKNIVRAYVWRCECGETEIAHSEPHFNIISVYIFFLFHSFVRFVCFASTSRTYVIWDSARNICFDFAVHIFRVDCILCSVFCIGLDVLLLS